MKKMKLVFGICVASAVLATAGGCITMSFGDSSADSKEAEKESKDLAAVPAAEPEVKDPQSLPAEEKQKLAEPILENLLKAMKEDSYKEYCKDFTQGLKDNVTEKDFKFRNDKMLDEIGEFKSKEFLGVLNKKLFDVFIWKAKFSKSDDDQIIRLFLISDENKYKVYMFNISPF